MLAMAGYAVKEEALSQVASSGIYADLHADFRSDLRDELPIEKKLIGFSLGIGFALLTLLAIVNHFFPMAA